MANVGAIRAARAFVELYVDNNALTRGLKSSERMVMRFGQSLQSLGQSFVKFGLLASLPFAGSLKTFSEFEDQMYAVKSIMGATAQEYDRLYQRAKRLGATTTWTSKQVAEGMYHLALSGFKEKEVQDAIAGIMDLARATRVEISEAAKIAGNAVRAFKLDTSKTAHVCDVLVTTANNSAQSLIDLGNAFNHAAQLGPVTGHTIEDFALVFGALANVGIKGSRAGTTLKNILTTMIKPTVTKQYRQLGVEIQDTNGKMLNVAVILRRVGEATKNLPDAQKLAKYRQFFTLWGLAGGANLTVANYDKFFDAMKNVNGAADRTAREMEKSLLGRTLLMVSAFQNLGITIGEALAPELKRLMDITSRITDGINAFLTKNKQWVVQAAKVVAYIILTGVSLMAAGLAFIGLAKIISFFSMVLATCCRVVTWLGMAILRTLLLPIALLIQTARGLILLFTGIKYLLCLPFVLAGRAVGFFAGIFIKTFRVIHTVCAGFVYVVAPIFKALAAVGAFTLWVMGKVALNIAAGFAVGFQTATKIVVLCAKTIMANIAQMMAAIWLCITVTVKKTIVGVMTSVMALMAILTVQVFRFIASYMVLILEDIRMVIRTLGILALRLIAIAGIIVGRIFMAINALFPTIITSLAIITNSLRRIIARTCIWIGNRILMVGGVFVKCLFSVLAIFTTIFSKIFIHASSKIIVSLTWFMMGFLHGLRNIIRATFQSTMKVLKNCTANIVRAVTKMFARMAKNLARIMEDLLDGIWTVAKGLIKTTWEAVGAILASIATVFAPLVMELWKLLGGIFKVVIGVLTLLAVALILYKMFPKFFDMVGAKIAAFVKSVGKSAEDLYDRFTKSCENIAKTLEVTYKKQWTPVLKAWFASLKEFAKKVYASLKEIVKYFMETFKAIGQAIYRGDIELAFNIMWTSIKVAWLTSLAFLGQVWNEYIDRFITAFVDSMGSIVKYVYSLWSKIRGLWVELVFSLKTYWNGFCDWFVDKIDMVLSKLYSYKRLAADIAVGKVWTTKKAQVLQMKYEYEFMRDRRSLVKKQADGIMGTTSEYRRRRDKGLLDAKDKATKDIAADTEKMNNGVDDIIVILKKMHAEGQHKFDLTALLARLEKEKAERKKLLDENKKRQDAFDAKKEEEKKKEEKEPVKLSEREARQQLQSVYKGMKKDVRDKYRKSVDKKKKDWEENFRSIYNKNVTGEAFKSSIGDVYNSIASSAGFVDPNSKEADAFMKENYGDIANVRNKKWEEMTGTDRTKAVNQLQKSGWYAMFNNSFKQNKIDNRKKFLRDEENFKTQLAFNAFDKTVRDNAERILKPGDYMDDNGNVRDSNDNRVDSIVQKKRLLEALGEEEYNKQYKNNVRLYENKYKYSEMDDVKYAKLKAERIGDFTKMRFGNILQNRELDRQYLGARYQISNQKFRVDKNADPYQQSIQKTELNGRKDIFGYIKGERGENVKRFVEYFQKKDGEKDKGGEYRVDWKQFLGKAQPYVRGFVKTAKEWTGIAMEWAGLGDENPRMLKQNGLQNDINRAAGQFNRQVTPAMATYSRGTFNAFEVSSLLRGDDWQRVQEEKQTQLLSNINDNVAKIDQRQEADDGAKI